MTPLEFDSSTQRWNAERSERCRPVWDGKSGVVAGDQRAGDDEHKSRTRCEYREAMVRAIVRCGEGFQMFTPGQSNYLPSFARRDSRGRLSPLEQ